MTTEFDLVVRNGTVLTQSGSVHCDVGIRNGIIAALGVELSKGKAEINASDHFVMPGGIEAHCHIEQVSSYGLMGADDFYSASVSAAFGGTTTIVPFACQHRGQELPDVIADYHARASEKSILDFSYHAMITDPTEVLLTTHLPALIKRGITSIKLFTAYDLMAVNDEQFLDLLAICREYGAITMVHAENNDMIKWMAKRLLGSGHTEPRYHAISHPRLAEEEAVYRCIAMATLVGAPLVVVHISTIGALKAVREAREKGLPIFGETCPQYVLMTASDLDRPGYEGAKFCFSPPPRGVREQEMLWGALSSSDAIQLFSSDHAPYRYDSTGKFARNAKPNFKEIANGIPGIELRLPLLFSEGVTAGRISLQQFVELSAVNAAKFYGLYPRKGAIAVGSDADIALWDPSRRIRVSANELHDNVGYSPYEGREIVGWPTTVIRRGEVIVKDGQLFAKPGSGVFLPRTRPILPAGTAQQIPEVTPALNFGANILPDAQIFDCSNGSQRSQKR